MAYILKYGLPVTLAVRIALAYLGCHCVQYEVSTALAMAFVHVGMLPFKRLHQVRFKFQCLADKMKRSIVTSATH